MKLRITEAGWAGYSGPFGNILFENGESVGEVSRLDADRVASLVSLVEVAADGSNGAQSGLAARMISESGTPAPTEVPLPTETEADRAARDEAQASAAKEKELRSRAGVRLYTEEELAQIADKRGIGGLREIAQPLGVKGRGIAELIAGINRIQKDIRARAGIQPGAAVAHLELDAQSLRDAQAAESRILKKLQDD